MKIHAWQFSILGHLLLSLAVNYKAGDYLWSEKHLLVQRSLNIIWPWIGSANFVIILKVCRNFLHFSDHDFRQTLITVRYIGNTVSLQAMAKSTKQY